MLCMTNAGEECATADTRREGKESCVHVEFVIVVRVKKKKRRHKQQRHRPIVVRERSNRSVCVRVCIPFYDQYVFEV